MKGKIPIKMGVLVIVICNEFGSLWGLNVTQGQLIVGDISQETRDYRRSQFRLQITVREFCDNTSTSLKPFHFLAGWSTSGSYRGITHFFMATRNTIKGVGGKNKEQMNNMSLG